MQYDDIHILNETAKQIGSLGFRATANFADAADERVQPAGFDSNGHMKLRAVRRGKTEQVEFIQRIIFDDVRDPRVLRTIVASSASAQRTRWTPSPSNRSRPAGP